MDENKNLIKKDNDSVLTEDEIDLLKHYLQIAGNDITLRKEAIEIKKLEIKSNQEIQVKTIEHAGKEVVHDFKMFEIEEKNKEKNQQANRVGIYSFIFLKYRHRYFWLYANCLWGERYRLSNFGHCA